MKQTKIKIVGLAVVWVVSAWGDVLVRDEFNTTGGPDYANGLYLSGADIGDAGGNATCTGGTIVGFDATKAWNQEAYFDAYANVLRLLSRTYGATYEGREITTDLSGKTKAYARTSTRMRSTAASASAAFAYGGFGGNATLGSAGGATVGFNWDGANWDLTLRYMDAGGTATTATIMEDITVDSTYDLIWEMDDTANSIRVWVNKTDLNATPDLTVGWGGTVSDITHMTYGFSETGSSGDIYYYDMTLADTAEDLGATPDIGLLVRDEFNTDAAADPANGIYLTGDDLGGAENKDVVGGTILGFNGSWASSAYYDAYAQMVRMVGTTYTTARTASRPLGVSMVGKTRLYASIVMRVADNPLSGAEVVAGFSDSVLSGSIGSAVGYKWDGSNWDMVLRYGTSGGTTFATIRENVAPNVYHTFNWRMDSSAGTIWVWLDNNNLGDAPDLAVSDWTGSIGSIDAFSSYFHGTGSGNDAYLDTALLGDTPEAVGISFVSATILDVVQLSGNIMALEINCERPADLYPQFSADLEHADWQCIAHSSSESGPFAITNLDYSTTSGSNVVIYTTVDQDSGFFRIARGGRTQVYAAPTAQGSGSGWDAANAAAYTDSDFWNEVQQTLAFDPVQVTMLDGNYAGSLILSDLGNADHALTLSGESAAGVVFNGDVSAQLSLNGCRNMALENLNFTGSGTSIGYSFKITAGSAPSRDIVVRNCDWYDMTGVIYGSSGVSHGSHDVLFENCTFKRIGQNTGSHMMYNAYGASNVTVAGCYFEDCAGSYVRFRADSDYGVVSNCTFVSTQTYANSPSYWDVFLDFAVFNDEDPGDEHFSRFATITGNTFQFSGSSPADRATIRFYHKGYDPTGWNYLMTAAEGLTLTGSDGAAKKSLLKNNCDIDFDQITIQGNTWLNESARIMFGSYADYGATSEGWDDIADVSDIVF